jgi:hypothetical protein
MHIPRVGAAIGAVAALATASAVAAVATGGGASGFALIVNDPSPVVYPMGSVSGNTCPDRYLLRLPGNALAIVREDVAAAMPSFAAQLHLDGTNAKVRAVPAVQSSFTTAKTMCGTVIWHNSLVAYVTLPHSTDAARSHYVFAAAFERFMGVQTLFLYAATN